MGQAGASVAAVSIEAKLTDFDRQADAAFDWLKVFMDEYREQIIQVARARLITGHFVHGDKYLFELDRGRLAGEIIEELADGVNYAARRLDI